MPLFLLEHCGLSEIARCGGIRPETGSALWMQAEQNYSHDCSVVLASIHVWDREQSVSFHIAHSTSSEQFCQAQSENSVSRYGLRIWQSPTRFPFPCLKHDEPPLAHKENSDSRLGAQDGCACDRVFREASTPACCKPAIIFCNGPWQWKHLQSIEQVTGVQNKRRYLNYV